MTRRGGKRQLRDQRKSRSYQRKYYTIITDGTDTETNYFNGLKNSLPEEEKNKIAIKIRDSIKHPKLIEKALAELGAQESEIWLVFDKDQIKERTFNQIIKEAKNKNLNVGWSNPCIEVWFHSYFGTMPKNFEAKQCINTFERDFNQKVGQNYKKNDDGIYKKLQKYGDEEKAITIAKERLEEEESHCINPSEMTGTTTVHKLVEGIKYK